jgi:hypothetical protein
MAAKDADAVSEQIQVQAASGEPRAATGLVGDRVEVGGPAFRSLGSGVDILTGPRPGGPA